MPYLYPKITSMADSILNSESNSTSISLADQNGITDCNHMINDYRLIKQCKDQIKHFKLPLK